jgi:hypothetical protein
VLVVWVGRHSTARNVNLGPAVCRRSDEPAASTDSLRRSKPSIPELRRRSARLFPSASMSAESSLAWARLRTSSSPRGAGYGVCAKTSPTQNHNHSGSGIERRIVGPQRRRARDWPGHRASVQIMMPLPIPFLLFLLAGWVNRQPLDAIEYRRGVSESREQGSPGVAGRKRLRFTGCSASPPRANREATRKRTAPRDLADLHPGYFAPLVPRARRQEV